MSFWGLHLLDISIVLAYFFGTLAIGKYLSTKIKGQNDFYLAGRKLGKAFQLFLNFGTITDSSGAPATASVIYREGVAGVWIGFQSLFLTPYYWFMYVWLRRIRLVTMADLFEDRFGGRFLSGLYAIFTIFVAIVGIGLGNLIACKTLQPMMVKPQSQYTAAEKEMVNNYQEFKHLQELSKTGSLPEQEKKKYEMLKSLSDRGLLNSYASYLNPLVFYILSGIIVAIYIILGGLTATAVIDALQAMLTVVFSVILIPFGLIKLHGFSGLHNNVPDYMFELFGSTGTSEYTWYSISAILFTTLIMTHSTSTLMGVGGSAKNELAARFGAVGGGFGKRFIFLAWILCSLIAVGLYGNSISDPDTTWGVLTRDLLPIGAIGLMLSGILAGKMASLGAQAISLSALFVRNIYVQFYPAKTDKHYVYVGRITIAVILALGVIVALKITGIVALLKVFITMGVTFGAPILLLFFWRRLTKAAVITEVVFCIFFIIIIPWVVPAFTSLRQHEFLTQRTNKHVATIQTISTVSDVKAGLAADVGIKISKVHRIEPVSIYYEAVTHVNPKDLNSPLEGIGRFHTEMFALSILGMDLKSLTPAGLMTVRFMVDGILPFIILFIVSYFTKQANKDSVDRFYVRLKTPVAATADADAAEIELSYKNPHRFDHSKLFPNSNWEMCKWTKEDFIGFMLCWAMVGIILGLLWLMLNAGRAH